MISTHMMFEAFRWKKLTKNKPGDSIRKKKDRLL